MTAVAHQPMPLTLDALRVLHASPLSLFKRHDRFSFAEYAVVCAWSPPSEDSRASQHRAALTSFCQRERLLWLHCVFSDMGEVWVPISDHWFMSNYQVAPAHMAEDYVNGAYRDHQQPFEQVVLGMVSRACQGLPLPAMQAAPTVSTAPGWQVCDGLIRLEAVEKKAPETAVHWPWLPVMEADQWVMFGDAATLAKLAVFFRQRDSVWSSSYERLAVQRQRDFRVSVLSETIAGKQDLVKISPGAVIRLQRMGSAGAYQGFGFGQHGAQRFEVSMEVHLSAQGQCQCGLQGDVVVSQTFTEVPAPPPLSGELSDQVMERLRFELGSVQLSVADLAAVRQGQVFELGVDHMPYVSIYLDQQRVGRGEIVVMNQHLAVQVLDFQLPD